ncbi:hypothetical protein AB9K34_22560 [Sedimentitalea sp. XS_ASV28]|uniref:hypothetical protein n=1 Tax=Sedimentitalea sp. XS_ASV28 TaxID=3241296 RepID=UPI0035155970
MTQQLYLHIGDCKTGSTTIQTTLAGSGLATPGTALLYPRPMQHGMLARTLTTHKHLLDKRWGAIGRSFASAEWDVGVISTELFEFSSPNRVAAALRQHIPDHAESLRVIAYVRPHTSRFLSQFAENLKNGHTTGDMQEFATRMDRLGRLDYVARLQKWRDVFGDRLIVRPFTRDRLARGDVRHDFLGLILEGRAYELGDITDANASLSLADLALMRLLQRRFAERLGAEHPSAIPFGKQFGRLLHATPSLRPFERLRLSRSLCDWFITRYRDDAEQMDSQWIGAPCFVPALLAAADDTVPQAQSLQAEDHFDGETLRLMTCWADLILRQMQDDPAAFGKRLRP